MGTGDPERWILAVRRIEGGPPVELRVSEAELVGTAELGAYQVFAAECARELRFWMYRAGDDPCTQRHGRVPLPAATRAPLARTLLLWELLRIGLPEAAPLALAARGDLARVHSELGRALYGGPLWGVPSSIDAEDAIATPGPSSPAAAIEVDARDAEGRGEGDGGRGISWLAQNAWSSTGTMEPTGESDDGVGLFIAATHPM